MASMAGLVGCPAGRHGADSGARTGANHEGAADYEVDVQCRTVMR